MKLHKLFFTLLLGFFICILMQPKLNAQPCAGNDLVFDDMEHGNPFGNGWFAFGGSVGGGSIGFNTVELPPIDGGAYSLETGWGSGGVPGYFGDFGRTYFLDLTGTTHFNIWINPDPGQDYLLEVNLQDDDNGDGVITFDNQDDEFQYNLFVSPSGTEVISGGGWQLVSIPLSDFFDDNSFLTGGNGVLDAQPTSAGGNGELINVVIAVISNSGADVTFRTDYWVFNCIPVPPQGSYDIYTVKTSSGSAERITFIDDADEYNPSFSNNGSKVAHDVVGGSAPLGHSIYITNVNSGVSTPLDGADGGNDASWSPNGQYIAFDRVPVGDLNIYVVPANGGTRSLVRENGVDAEWSNNSKRLVFQDVTDNSVRTVDVNSGSETIVAAFGFNPSWSPNGKYVAYSDGNNIFKIKVNQSGEPKGSPVQLSNDGVDVFNQQPSWSNNSKTIVFHSNRVSGDFDIWTVSASGGTPELLTGDPGNGDFDPCYSKNGKYVAYDGFTDAGSSKKNFDDEEFSSNENTLPNKYVLNQNFPNPFNPTTQIRFGIPEAGTVTLNIYNSVGQLIKTLVDGNMSEGFHQVTWNATDNSGSKLSSGVYFYRLTAGSFTQINKMLLLK